MTGGWQASHDVHGRLVSWYRAGPGSRLETVAPVNMDGVDRWIAQVTVTHRDLGQEEQVGFFFAGADRTYNTADDAKAALEDLS